MSVFNFNKIDNFEKHINLSIPNYNTLFNIVENLCVNYSKVDGGVIDIGCTTGRLLDSLSKKGLKNLKGVDINGDKILYDTFEFCKGEAHNMIEHSKSRVYVSMFTLQFMSTIQRKKTIDILREKVKDGAVFIVSEKVYIDNSKINNILHRLHFSEKSKNFGMDELLKKDLDMLSGMFPLSSTELEKELVTIGKFEQIWQSYNFKSYVVY